MSRGRRTVGGLIAAVLASACTSAWADPVIANRAPRLTPADDSAEGGLWEQSRVLEAGLKKSAQLDQDPALTGFVRGVVCKIAAEYCSELRVYVLDEPIFQAFAAPNGVVAVYSGLLLRARDEDELAYVLGHEVSHFARSHSLQRWQTLKSTATAGMILTVGLGIVGSLAYLAALSSVFAFDRDQESEADRLGLERMRLAGYAPSAAPAIWTDVMAETQASDFPKVRASEGRAGVFRSHPITPDRIAALSAAQGGSPPRPVADEAAAERRYRSVIRPHLAAWLKDELRRRDWGESLHLLARLESEGEDFGVIAFYRGELYRQRRADGDLALARAAYQASTSQPDAPVEAWRELGESARKAGDKAAARDAFSAYLEHAPAAQDRWLVEAGLKSL